MEIVTIDDCPGYGVTRDGRIWSYPKVMGHHNGIWLKLTPMPNYLGFKITGGVKYVHKAVAETFISNLDNKPCVNHKDGNKQNNNVDNLEWCTYSENNLHATGIIQTSGGEHHYKAKLTSDDVIFIRANFSGGLQKWADRYGVDQSTIWNVTKRRIWKYI